MIAAFNSEAKATLILATPLIIGQLSNVAMGFVDTLFAGRLSALDLAAVAIGSVVWSSLNLFIIGAMLAVPAFVSQYDGAGERHKMASFTRQAAWLGLALSVVVFVTVRNVSPVLEWIQIEPEVIPLAAGYLKSVSWGAPFWALFLVLRFLSEGLGRTGPTMYFGLFALLLNIPADYVFMYGMDFGLFQIPALGAPGCGLATAVVLATQCLAMLIYVGRHKAYRFLKLFQLWEWPNLPKLVELARIGLPIGTTIFVESSLFMLASLLMGRLGTVELAGHQIALNFAALMFMIPLGLAMAITVRVGNAVGRGDAREARFRGWAGISLALITQLFTATLIFLFPEQIAKIYTKDPAVAEVAVALLFFAAVFQLSDGLQAAAAGALRGIKDTKWPMWMTTFAYWVVGVPVCYGLGIVGPYRGAGIWIGLLVGLTVAAVALLTRFGWQTQDPARVLRTRLD